MKLESFDSIEDKRRWKVVRTDNYADVPGEIVCANEDDGTCTLQVPKAEGGVESKAFTFGPRGIRIVGRGR